LFKIFFGSKLQFTYPYVSIKDVQATEEAFSPQKRTSSTFKNKIINFFYYCGSFLPCWIRIHIRNPGLDTDPGTPLNPDPIRIRIHNTAKKWKNLASFRKIMISPLKETSECVNCPFLQLPPDKIHSFVLFHLIIINIQIMINFLQKDYGTISKSTINYLLDNNPLIMSSVIRNVDAIGKNHKLITRWSSQIYRFSDEVTKKANETTNWLQNR
jgi:hypothetical protein